MPQKCPKISSIEQSTNMNYEWKMYTTLHMYDQMQISLLFLSPFIDVYRKWTNEWQMTSVESSHRCMLALKFSFQNATAIAREMQCYEYEDDVCALYILFQYYSSRMLKDIKCTEIECERERERGLESPGLGN